nr:hypothetical protein DM860_013816 [Ipomoea trifida]
MNYTPLREKPISILWCQSLFDSEQSAMIAISCLHGTMIEGKKLYVSCYFVVASMPIRKYHCSLFPSILGFFYSHEDAKRAVEGLNGALLGSKPLVVVRAQKKIDREEVSRCVNDDSISIDHQKL